MSPEGALKLGGQKRLGNGAGGGLLKGGKEGFLGPGTDDLIHDFAAFEDVHGGDAADFVFGGEFGIGLDIDFTDAGEIRVFLGDLFQDGRHLFAGDTPLRPEIDEIGLIGTENFARERLLVQIYNFAS